MWFKCSKNGQKVTKMWFKSELKSVQIVKTIGQKVRNEGG